MFDGSEKLCAEDGEVIKIALDTPVTIAVVSKSDLPMRIDIEHLRSVFPKLCAVSSVTGDGLDKLENMVKDCFPAPEYTPGEILTNARQRDAVSSALDCLYSARDALISGGTPDIVLSECEAAMSCISQLTGKSVNEDVVSRIFDRFCVGK
jgi:tRNA modification GTPase